MSERPTFDPQIRTQNIAFDPEAMVACEGCGRMNPPNRLKCIYCAKELVLAAENAAAIIPVLRKLEMWESGHNLIVRERTPEPDVTAAARLLTSETEEIAAILDAAVPLPIARLESEKEAGVVQQRLSQFGIGCSIVGDADLAPEKQPVRLSSIEFGDRELILIDFNTAERMRIAAEEFVLLVPGVINVDRVDILEKKRRGAESKPLDESPTASDQMLLDIYTRVDSIGFRVHLAGFDFSCLGDDKGLLAGENLRRLIVRLADELPNTMLVNNYTAVRHALGKIWEPESRNDSRGLLRSGFGKVEFGSTASSSNHNQFTKYSRLQWHLL